MAQLPFPAYTPTPPAHPAQPYNPYAPSIQSDPVRRASLAGGPALVGGGVAAGAGQAGSPGVPYTTNALRSAPHQATYGVSASVAHPGAYPQSGFVPSPYANPAVLPSRQPVPPPRRSSTLPSLPSQPDTHPQPAPAPAQLAEDPLAAHHRSLVAYYWDYAQKGYVAPLTAVKGTEEYERQRRARTEAVEWARQCGLQVREVESEAGPAEAQRAWTRSAPLSSAPTAFAILDQGVAPVPAVAAVGPSPSPSIGSGRPLPAAPAPQAALGRSVSLANPPPASSPVGPSATGGTGRSVSDTSPRSHPFSPLTPASSSYTPPAQPMQRPESPPKKRPLPIPPVTRSAIPAPAQLADRLQNVSITAAPAPPPPRSPSPAPVPPAIPTFSFDDNSTPSVVAPRARSPSPGPTPPAVPSFSFTDDTSPAAPTMPIFSFDVDDGSSSSSQPITRRPPPLHPRDDPTHPSHALYHPTSVSSPLPPPNSSLPSSSTLPSVTHPFAEAGTLNCTSCHQPIFGRVLLALSRQWHPNCFVCAEEGCGEKLEVIQFEGTPEDWEDEEESEDGEERESLKGKAWCMVHFEERFALQCHHCLTPIASADYLPIADPSLPPRTSSSRGSRNPTRYYHPLHFFCAGCGDPFLDPVAYERSGEAIAKPYWVREAHPYCERCDLRMWRIKCPGCGKGLREEDGYVEVEDPAEEGKRRKWHEGCFKCCMCAKPLTGLYLLRPDDSDDAQDSSEKAYCGECYDIKAKEEAMAATG
ncbi:hypothetical protein JCM5296_001767 [Sporobolomyces johnsonii]